MTDSIIQHLLENKKHTANHRNSKKTTTFVFNKCSVTYLRKCPIIQHLVSDSGHSQKRLKESGTTHICKAMKYTDLHLSPHSVYLSKQRLYRLKWTVTDNQWCKYAASGRMVQLFGVTLFVIPLKIPLPLMVISCLPKMLKVFCMPLIPKPASYVGKSNCL